MARDDGLRLGLCLPPVMKLRVDLSSRRDGQLASRLGFGNDRYRNRRPAMQRMPMRRRSAKAKWMVSSGWVMTTLSVTRSPGFRPERHGGTCCCEADGQIPGGIN